MKELHRSTSAILRFLAKIPTDNSGHLKRPGLAAPPGRFLRPEIIGPPDCPLLHRWTLVSTGPVKLMVHHFLPNADDRAVHDHPRPFWTFVLWGGYDDMAPCEVCRGIGSDGFWPYPHPTTCEDCDGEGVVFNERMRAGMLRYRPATHRHRTRVHSSGAWTVVLMGPVRRRWGFWRDGQWWFWRDHERTFGWGMRCGDEIAE